MMLVTHDAGQKPHAPLQLLFSCTQTSFCLSYDCSYSVSNVGQEMFKCVFDGNATLQHGEMLNASLAEYAKNRSSKAVEELP